MTAQQINTYNLLQRAMLTLKARRFLDHYIIPKAVEIFTRLC